jgi:hypothetical protein
MTDFPRLIEALCRAEVEFIIVGGLAATIHGGSRLTQDIDIVYSRTSENLRRLAAALAPHHPYLRGAPTGLPFDWSPATLRHGLNFTLTTDIGDIDLFGEIAGGGSYDDLVDQTNVVSLFGHECRCVNVASLIRLKRAAGRPRDLETIAELEALAEESRDER